jgi:hypothetical protein
MAFLLAGQAEHPLHLREGILDKTPEEIAAAAVVVEPAVLVQMETFQAAPVVFL